MWDITPIYRALQLACEIAKTKDSTQIKEKLVKLGMELWQMIDPTPEFQLDDRIVKALISWTVDRILEEM